MHVIFYTVVDEGQKSVSNVFNSIRKFSIVTFKVCRKYKIQKLAKGIVCSIVERGHLVLVIEMVYFECNWRTVTLTLFGKKGYAEYEFLPSKRLWFKRKCFCEPQGKDSLFYLDTKLDGVQTCSMCVRTPQIMCEWLNEMTNQNRVFSDPGSIKKQIQCIFSFTQIKV